MAHLNGSNVGRWWRVMAVLALAVVTSANVARADDLAYGEEEGSDLQVECHEQDTSAEPASCPQYGEGVFSDGRRISLRLVGVREVTVTTTRDSKIGNCVLSTGETFTATETKNYGMYETAEGYGVEINCYTRDVTWHGPRRSEESVNDATLTDATF